MLLTSKSTLLIYAVIYVTLQGSMMHNKGHLMGYNFIHICNINKYKL